MLHPCCQHKLREAIKEDQKFVVTHFKDGTISYEKVKNDGEKK